MVGTTASNSTLKGQLLRVMPLRGKEKRKRQVTIGQFGIINKVLMFVGIKKMSNITVRSQKID